MSYPIDKLGNHIQILSGFAFKSKDFSDSGVPVIKIKNVTPPSVSLIDLSYVSQDVANQNFKFILEYDDVLIALTGSHINQMASVVGRVARVKYHEKTVLNQRVAKIMTIDKNDCDLDFVYYYLSQESVKLELASKAGGAANQANISPTDVKNLMAPFPNIKIQRKISSILKSYDDLIENNQKQIKLLEEAAQRLYKEWFVDLRFPGYENTHIIDGIPQGWDIRTLDTFGEIITGKTPSTANKSYYNGDIPFVKIPDMHDTIYPIVTESKLSKEGANTQKNKFIPKDSIMVSCIATVGLVNIAVQACQTNQQINSIVLNDVRDLYYLYFSTKGLKMLLDGVGSNGATMTNVNKSKFGNVEMLYPTNELCQQFYDFCKPIFEKILVLSKSTLELKNSRDQLLPKLMSGELEV